MRAPNDGHGPASSAPGRRGAGGAAALLVLALLAPHVSGQKPREADLAEKYREWMNLVQYIILPVERNVFLKLTSDRDRDIFIETFWKQRDPTPGTPLNEFKEEHVKRFLHANKFYSRGTTREGWRTDMGRIHIILGPPAGIERFEASSYLVPCQAWSYYGDPTKDMPQHFILVFFQRGGAGEYRLYDPLGDGPGALLLDVRDLDLWDYAQVYERIRELAPTLADSALSIVPGEHNYDYTPSVRSNIILANILNSPHKSVNAAYATHFLDYKGLVSTEYLTNYIDSETDVSVIEDPLLGVPFVHFAIVPKNLSVDYYAPRDQYYCNLRLDVSLREGEKIFFQYSRDFPFYFDEKDLDRVRSNGLSLEDSFPVIEGRFRLIVLLQNSVGKEFSILEKPLDVPPPAGKTRISGPFLGHRLEDYGTQVHIPYKVLDKKLLLDPKNTFTARDNLAFLLNVVDCPREVWESGAARVRLKGARPDAAERSFTLLLSSVPFQRVLSLSHSLPLADLPPDYYEMKVAVTDAGGGVLDEATARFVLSPAAAVAHPIANAKSFPLSNRHLFYHMLAQQYDRTNEDEKAEEMYRRTAALEPGFREGALDYAVFLLKVRQFGRALEAVEVLSADEKSRFDYFLIRGQAQMGLGRYAEAIASLIEGNKIYNSDIRLLNSLGYCYYKRGEAENALQILRTSLRLNPNQENVKSLIAEVEKGRR
ncbi:MAG: GWxTD domain-containing protein [Candidatus Aminicenantes bacterium]|nr:GWxTD domain-containing protein [Candidatus Aminicenantes bacterium]